MLITAVAFYAALGAVLDVLPSYVPTLGVDAVLVGLAVGAPAFIGAIGRSWTPFVISSPRTHP